MSSGVDAGAVVREEANDDPSYGEMHATLDALLRESMDKVESGRVYNAENERVRQGWIRLSKDIVAEMRKVKQDRDLEELAERVDDLEGRR